MRQSRAQAEKRNAYFLFVLPAVLIYWGVMAFPSFFSVWLSLTDYAGGQIFGGPRPINFVGLRHYFRMFDDPLFWISLKNNMYIMLVSVFGQIPLGFIIAYVLHRKLVGLRGIFQTLIYLPCVISTIVIGILWQSFFSPWGPLTELMQRFNPGWENYIFLDYRKAIMSVLFVILWMYTGTYMIIFLANLEKIPPETIEAARIDGANEWQILGRVVVPALSQVILTTCILAISGSLKSFDLIYAMTQGNPARRTSVLSIYMYDNAFFGAPDFPLANAVSTTMVLISIIMIVMVTLVERRFGGRE